jgi:hypothetical protein
VFDVFILPVILFFSHVRGDERWLLPILSISYSTGLVMAGSCQQPGSSSRRSLFSTVGISLEHIDRGVSVFPVIQRGHSRVPPLGGEVISILFMETAEFRHGLTDFTDGVTLLQIEFTVVRGESQRLQS